MHTTQNYKFNYLIVIDLKIFPISNEDYAIESAFALHLNELKNQLGINLNRFSIIAVEMSPHDYDQQKDSLNVVNKKDTGFDLILVKENKSLKNLIPNLIHNLRSIYYTTKNADVIHSGYTFILKPYNLLSILLGILFSKKTIYVVDVDIRDYKVTQHKSIAEKIYKFFSYKILSELSFILHIKFAAKYCTLVLLKSKKLINDFGKGRDNVKYFLDSAFSSSVILNREDKECKIARIKNNKPLKLAYFGRLIELKGINRSLDIVRYLIDCNANIRFDIIGDGNQKQYLIDYAENKLNLKSHVTFHNSLPYGKVLFEKLKEFDILLLTPILHDTPRNALDALAIGMPIISYRTAYLEELFESNAICLIPDSQNELVANEIIKLDQDRDRLCTMINNAISYSIRNSQEEWIKKRIEWTKTYCKIS